MTKEEKELLVAKVEKYEKIQETISDYDYVLDLLITKAAYICFRSNSEGKLLIGYTESDIDCTSLDCNALHNHLEDFEDIQKDLFKAFQELIKYRRDAKIKELEAI